MTGTPNPTTRKAMAELEAGKGEPFDIAELGNEDFAPFDPAEHLETEEAVAAFLDGVMEHNADDPAYVAHALGVVARARARIAGTADTKR